MSIVDVTAEEVKEMVYNIEVAEFHTYHVGELGVWVHNDGCAGTKRGADEGLDTRAPTRARTEPDSDAPAPSFFNRRGWLSPFFGYGVEGPLTLAETNRLNTSAAQYQAPGYSRRPAYAQGQVDTVWNRAVIRSGGQVTDPNVGVTINWDGGRRAGVWDMGHLTGHEYRYLQRSYSSNTIDGSTFLRTYRNPGNYQPENPSANRSHQFETH